MKCYTDGSTYPKNPGLGGAGFVAFGNKSNYVRSWHIPRVVTNNEIETQALLGLIEFVEENQIHNVTINTDSQYVFYGVRRLVSNRPVLSSHSHLWDKIVDLLERGNITVTPILVEGHSGIRGNEVADCLAYLAAQEKNIINKYIVKDNFESFREALKNEKKEARKKNKGTS